MEAVSIENEGDAWSADATNQAEKRYTLLSVG